MLGLKKVKVGDNVCVVSGPLASTMGKVTHTTGGLVFILSCGIEVCYICFTLWKWDEANSTILSFQLHTIVLSKTMDMLIISHMVTL